MKDGDEDDNKNGRVDPGERNPLFAPDDNPSGALPPPLDLLKTLEGGGCSCEAVGTSSGSNTSPAAALAIAALGLVLVRRKQR